MVFASWLAATQTTLSNHGDHPRSFVVLNEGSVPGTVVMLSKLGLKERLAFGHTNHLLTDRAQLLVEMLLVEISSPTMLRTRDPALYDVPLLRVSSGQ